MIRDEIYLYWRRASCLSLPIIVRLSIFKFSSLLHQLVWGLGEERKDKSCSAGLALVAL